MRIYEPEEFQSEVHLHDNSGHSREIRPDMKNYEKCRHSIYVAGNFPKDVQVSSPVSWKKAIESVGDALEPNTEGLDENNDSFCGMEEKPQFCQGVSSTMPGNAVYVCPSAKEISRNATFSELPTRLLSSRNRCTYAPWWVKRQNSTSLDLGYHDSSGNLQFHSISPREQGFLGSK